MVNNGVESVEVKSNITRQCTQSKMTDAQGFANLGPFTPGEAVAVEIDHDGFDNVKQDITADENQESVMLGMNPTVSNQNNGLIHFLHGNYLFLVK